MSQPVVVRFAPSPTGPLHIGGVRTALYSYLLAKKHNGRCILRIEDTDRTRFVPGAEDHINEGLAWIGIEFTEGVREGGEFGPYRQSDRAKDGLYRKHADQLLANGKAYMAFDTPEELEAMRERLKAEGSSVQQYNYATRNEMTNSLTLSEEEVKRRIDAGDPYVVRMKMPDAEDIHFQDLVRGDISFHSSQLDDKILLKSDGMPTYHLAVVVDDKHMGVTHIIRGEEWVSSTPLHVKMYEAFGWEEFTPKFVHLPLILNPNGKGKMSKRQGDKLGFSVFPISWTDPETGNTSIGYREQGYLPGAMRNFLALLGWNPGNDEELMDLDRLVEVFSLEKINNSGTKFDLDKLKWFNETYLRQEKGENLLPSLKAEIEKAGHAIPSDEFLLGMMSMMKERVSFVKDFVESGPYFFERPREYNAKMTRKSWNEGAIRLMTIFKEKASALEEWEATGLHGVFEQICQEEEVGAGRVLAPLRLVLTGLPSGPGAFDIAALLGKEETVARIEKAILELPIAEK